MFVIKIDVWPHGDTQNQYNQCTIAAYNDGTGTHDSGNYKAWIVPAKVVARGDDAIKAYVWHVTPTSDGATVKGFPRGHDQHHLPALASEIIDALGCREFLAA